MATVPNLAEVKNKVLERLLIVDDSVLRLDDKEIEDAISNGLDYFNIVAPLDQVHQEVGDGSKRRFVLTGGGITDWVASVSHVSDVAFVGKPDTDEEQIHSLRKESWIQSVATAGEEVLTTSSVCPSNETVRINWYTESVIEDLDGATSTTISERYTEAFYLYATYAGALAVTRKAARLKQSSYGADITSLSEIYDRWVEIARSLKKEADSRIGSIRGSVRGIGQSVVWSTRSRFGGGFRISHGDYRA